MTRLHTVRAGTWYLCNWLGPLQLPISHRLCHLYHPIILPETNHFHSNILCMWTGGSFLLKRFGEMGGFRDSADLGLIHLVMTTRPQFLSLPKGKGRGMVKEGRSRAHSP